MRISGTRWGRLVSAAAVTVLAAGTVSVAAAPAAQAAFPGPNGKIYYASAADSEAPTQLFSVNPDGTGVTQLTTASTDHAYPASSVDGKKLAFLRLESSGVALWTADADGTDQAQIATGVGFSDSWPSWSPAGKIAYVNDSDNIVVVNADGTGATNLGNGRGPAFSPDGTKIAFARSGGTSDLWVMNADGTGATQLTNGSTGYGLYVPAWSPDGTKIVARSLDTSDASAGVATVNADGTGLAVLGATDSNDTPRWSPDGTRIVYTDGGVIRTMNATNGANKTTVFTSPADGYTTASDWAVTIRDADLAVTVADSADPVTLGAPVTYTVTITNNGTATATGVTATTTLTGATATIGTVTGSQGTCTVTAPTVTCAIGNLAPAGTATVTIVVTPTAAGTVTATSTVAASQTDPTPANNTAAQSTTVNANALADIATTVDAQPNLGILTPYLTYTLSARNNGPNAATSATLTASLPNRVTATNLSAGCTASPGTVVCTYGAIANGATANKTFRVPLSLLSIGQVTVTGVRTTSAPADTVPGNDTDSATCTVISILLATCN